MSRLVGVEALLIRAAEPERLRAFYAAVFDLNFSPTEEGGFVAEAGPLRIAIGPAGRTDRPRPRVAPMFAVSDIIAALSSVEDMERLVRDHYETPEGRFAFLFDPEGNELGLFQSSVP